MLKRILLILISTLVLAGCSHNKVGTGGVSPTPRLVGEYTEVKVGEAGDQLVGNYRVYDKVLYEQAKADGKVILLYFYANWCPTCRVQEPVVVDVFRELVGNDNIVGFRVNTLDDATTPDGKALATEFGVTYQHTFVVLGTDGQVAKQLNGMWEKEEMLEFVTRLGGG